MFDWINFIIKSHCQDKTKGCELCDFHFHQTKDKLEPQASARKAVLSNLPRVIASVAVLWQALTQRKERYVFVQTFYSMSYKGI